MCICSERSDKGVTPLEIEFRGVVASDAAVLIKGYYQE